MNLFQALVASTVVLTQVTATPAIQPAPLPLPQRIATANVVVVGKVVSLEDKIVEVGTTRYVVAVVKVDEALMGGKGVKGIRVGFIAPEPPPPPPVPGQPVLLIKRRPPVSLAKDQEACLILTKLPEGDFYTMQNWNCLIPKQSANFEKDTAEIRRLAGLLADPKAGLESKTADDRFLTAGMLVVRYRMSMTFNNPSVPRQQEPIDAAESKAILKVLATTDWTPNPTFGRFSPQLVFGSLGLTEKDGWKQPKDYKEMPEQAKKWLDANAETYRIQRFVVTEAK